MRVVVKPIMQIVVMPIAVMPITNLGVVPVVVMPIQPIIVMSVVAMRVQHVVVAPADDTDGDEVIGDVVVVGADSVVYADVVGLVPSELPSRVSQSC